MALNTYYVGYELKIFITSFTEVALNHGYTFTTCTALRYSYYVAIWTVVLIDESFKDFVFQDAPS